MRRIIFLVSLLLIIPCFSLANTYLTTNDINSMIDCYNQLFSAELPNFDKSVNYSKLIISYAKFGSSYKQCLAFTDNSNVSFSGSGLAGDVNFYVYTLSSSGVWSTKSTSYSGLFPQFPQILITDNLPVIDTTVNVYYTYNLASGDVSKRITQVEQDVSSLTTRLTTVEETVTNLSSESASISEKMDTVIDNQNKLYEEPSSTSDDFSSAFPSVDVPDQTEDTFNSIVNSVFDVFTQSGNQTITLNFRNSTYYVNSDDFDLSSTGLSSFLSVLSSFGISLLLAKDLRKEINKIKEGNIEQIANEDISANIV